MAHDGFHNVSELTDLEDSDQCPGQSIRRKRFRPTTLYVGHTRLAPRSWLIICGVPQFISQPRSKIACVILGNSYAAWLTNCIYGVLPERSSNLTNEL